MNAAPHAPKPDSTDLPQDGLAFALREAAVLVQAVREGRNFTEALSARAHWPPGVRGAVADLCYGTLRDFGRGDFWLAQLLQKPLTEPLAHSLLLVALHRLEVRPQQAHTVVDQAVQAAGGIKRGALRGLINAVLRNFLRQREALIAAADADPVAGPRHARWWQAALGRAHPAAVAQIIAAGNSHPPMALRVNRQHATREAVLADLQAAGMAARAVDEDGILLETPCPVAALPGFAQGRVSVQDLGAQHAARLLDAQPGMRVLDACAAPGGKTAHMLERAAVHLLALDADATRAARITQNLERLALSARVQVADCRDTRAYFDGVPFDRILADVPCSASGVARRHPDIKWLRREADIAKFARQQREILEALWPLLAPGGRLLYATCSVFAAENGEQITAFCARHTDALRVPIAGAADCAVLPGPEHDGFYYALLEKRA